MKGEKEVKESASGRGGGYKEDLSSLSKCERINLFLSRYVTSTMPYTQKWVIE